jgi:metal-responsive CopG/Arc/MetJ family transcriptional regulator
MAREKQQITVTLDPTLVKWLDAMIGRHVFANRSHGVEACISIAKEREGELFPGRQR